MSQESLSSRLLNRVNVFREKIKDAEDRDVYPTEGQLSLIALVEEAGIALATFDRKPVAYLGREKHPTPGKDGPAVYLAFPDSPRSDLYEWTPLFDA